MRASEITRVDHAEVAVALLVALLSYIQSSVSLAADEDRGAFYREIVIMSDHDRRIPLSQGANEAGLTRAETQQAMSSLGIIACPAKGTYAGIEGTAALVGDNRTIVTVAHALRDDEGGGRLRVKDQDCYFANYTEPANHIPLSRVDFIIGDPKESQTHLDYAVAHLMWPVGGALPFQSDTSNIPLEQGDPIIFMGNSFRRFGMGLGTQPRIQECRVIFVYDMPVYLTNCDEEQGDSGALNLTRSVHGRLVIKGLIMGSVPGSFTHCRYSNDDCATIAVGLWDDFLVSLHKMLKAE